MVPWLRYSRAFLGQTCLGLIYAQLGEAMASAQPQSRLSSVAFFGLDKTLLDTDSQARFAQYERKVGRLSTSQWFRNGLWLGLQRLSWLDAQRVYERALQHWRGLSACAIQNEVERWFRAELAPRLRPGGARALALHRERGDLLVLVANTSDYIAAAAARAWGMDAYLANPIVADASGCLTGECERPPCYGAGKLERVRRFIAEQGLSFDGAHFYTDSYSDMPMLAAVTHPCVVNPEPQLRLAAKRRGWPVADWRVEPL